MPWQKFWPFLTLLSMKYPFRFSPCLFIYGSMYIGIVSSLIHLGPNYSPCSYLSSHNDISRFFSWAHAYLPCSFHWLCRFHCMTGLELNQFPIKASSKSFAALWVALVVKNLPANAGDMRDNSLIPGLGRLPGGGHSNPLVFLPGESHGQRCLMGYSP